MTKPDLLVFSYDRDLGDNVVELARRRGARPQLALTLGQACLHLYQHSLAGAILDATLNPLGVRELIEQLRFDGQTLPLLALSTVSDEPLLASAECTVCVLAGEWPARLQDWVSQCSTRASGFLPRPNLPRVLKSEQAADRSPRGTSPIFAKVSQRR